MADTLLDGMPCPQPACTSNRVKGTPQGQMPAWYWLLTIAEALALVNSVVVAAAAWPG